MSGLKYDYHGTATSENTVKQTVSHMNSKTALYLAHSVLFHIDHHLHESLNKICKMCSNAAKSHSAAV